MKLYWIQTIVAIVEFYIQIAENKFLKNEIDLKLGKYRLLPFFEGNIQLQYLDHFFVVLFNRT